MDKLKGDAAHLVAAALTQAEMTLRARSIDPGQANRLASRYADHRGLVGASYEYFLTLVTTGERPIKAEDPAKEG